MDIEEVHTLLANIGVSSLPYRKSREGLQQAPFGHVGGRVTKNTSGGKFWQHVFVDFFAKERGQYTSFCIIMKKSLASSSFTNIPYTCPSDVSNAKYKYV